MMAKSTCGAIISRNTVANGATPDELQISLQLLPLRPATPNWDYARPMPPFVENLV